MDTTTTVLMSKREKTFMQKRIIWSRIISVRSIHDRGTTMQANRSEM
jgi:hypothetical protein